MPNMVTILSGRVLMVSDARLGEAMRHYPEFLQKENQVFM